MKEISPTLFLLFLQNQSLFQMLNSLPPTDIVVEMQSILVDQGEIFTQMIDKSDINPHEINDLIDEMINIYNHYNQENPLTN